MDESTVRALREHWDARYATPGRIPLVDPVPGFSEWIESHDDDGAVLVIGDGEGRHALVVPPQHPVTMVELSPVAAATCRRLADRPLEVVVAEAFGWLRSTPWRWQHVAMLYLPTLADEDLDLLIDLLAGVRAAGGGFFIEQARAGLPAEHEQRLVAALGAPTIDVSRGDVERLRFIC